MLLQLRHHSTTILVLRRLLTNPAMVNRHSQVVQSQPLLRLTTTRMPHITTIPTSPSNNSSSQHSKPPRQLPITVTPTFLNKDIRTSRQHPRRLLPHLPSHRRPRSKPINRHHRPSILLNSHTGSTQRRNRRPFPLSGRPLSRHRPIRDIIRKRSLRRPNMRQPRSSLLLRKLLLSFE